jgi:hypothetical protein
LLIRLNEQMKKMCGFSTLRGSFPNSATSCKKKRTRRNAGYSENDDRKIVPVFRRMLRHRDRRQNELKATGARPAAMVDNTFETQAIP